MASCFLATDSPAGPAKSSYNLDTSVITASDTYLLELPLNIVDTAVKIMRGKKAKQRALEKAKASPSAKSDGSKPSSGGPAVDTISKSASKAKTSVANATPNPPKPAGPGARKRKRGRSGKLVATAADVAEEVSREECPKPDTDSPNIDQEPKNKRRRITDPQGGPKTTTSPAVTPKTCSNCGTVATKSRAKKCHNCQKFFYDHWAQRCRIPPCPKCHYSRKARGCTMLPKSCERCGHVLPKGEDADGESNSVVESECHNETKLVEDGESKAVEDESVDLKSSVDESEIKPASDEAGISDESKGGDETKLEKSRVDEAESVSVHGDGSGAEPEQLTSVEAGVSTTESTEAVSMPVEEESKGEQGRAVAGEATEKSGDQSTQATEDEGSRMEQAASDEANISTENTDSLREQAEQSDEVRPERPACGDAGVSTDSTGGVSVQAEEGLKSGQFASDDVGISALSKKEKEEDKMTSDMRNSEGDVSNQSTPTTKGLDEAVSSSNVTEAIPNKSTPTIEEEGVEAHLKMLPDNKVKDSEIKGEIKDECALTQEIGNNEATPREVEDVCNESSPTKTGHDEIVPRTVPSEQEDVPVNINKTTDQERSSDTIQEDPAAKVKRTPTKKGKSKDKQVDQEMSPIESDEIRMDSETIPDAVASEITKEENSEMETEMIPNEYRSTRGDETPSVPPVEGVATVTSSVPPVEGVATVTSPVPPVEGVVDNNTTPTRNDDEMSSTANKEIESSDGVTLKMAASEVELVPTEITRTSNDKERMRPSTDQTEPNCSESKMEDAIPVGNCLTNHQDVQNSQADSESTPGVTITDPSPQACDTTTPPIPGSAEQDDPCPATPLSQRVVSPSDELPQISAMMSNLENATTIIASSSETLKWEEPPEEGHGGNEKEVDKYKYFAQEFRKLYAQQPDQEDSPGDTGSVSTCTADISESPGASTTMGDALKQGTAKEEGKKQRDSDSDQAKSEDEPSPRRKLKELRPKPVPSQQTMAVTTPGPGVSNLGPLMTIQLAQILNQMQGLPAANSLQKTASESGQGPDATQPNPDGSETCSSSESVSGETAATSIDSSQNPSSSTNPQLQSSMLPSVAEVMAMVEQARANLASIGVGNLSDGGGGSGSSKPVTSLSGDTIPSLDSVSGVLPPPLLIPNTGVSQGVIHKLLVANPLVCISGEMPPKVCSAAPIALSCPPPLKSIPQRTQDNSVVKIPSRPANPPVPKSTTLESLLVDDKSADKTPGVSADASSGATPPLSLTKTLISNSNNLAANLAHKLLVATIGQNLSSPGASSVAPSAPTKPGVVLASICQDKLPDEVSSEGLPNSTSSFHKLDLSLSSASAQMGNKIRVSLLKQMSKQQQQEIASITPSPLPISLPLPSAGHHHGATPPPPTPPAELPNSLASTSTSSLSRLVTSTVPPLLISAPSNSISIPVSSPSQPPNAKFQNFAVSPKLSVIATVETQKSLSSIASEEGKAESLNGGAVEEADSEGVFPTGTDYVITSAFSTSKSNEAASNLAAPSSNSPPLSTPPSTVMGLDGNKQLDAAVIEKLASKVQLQIKDALMSSEDPDTKTTPTPPPITRPTGMYRKILPNTTKQQSSPLPVSFSHVRTPGVVTVQVCSSIPASLTLSSITNQGGSPTQPGIAGGNSGEGGGGERASDPSSRKPGFPGIIKPRSVMTGGGNVMVTPLSPTVLPSVRAVAQIVTSKPKEGPVVGTKISSRTRSRNTLKETGSSEALGSHLVSEESLNSSLDSSEQASEAGSSKNRRKTSTGGSGKQPHGSEEDVAEEGGDSEGEGDNDEGKKRGADEGDSSKDRKRQKGGRKKKPNDMLLYTVKLRDSYMHHLMWNEHRVVLIVPISTSKTDINTRSRSTGEGPSGAGLADSTTPTAASSERKRRRKPKIETLHDADEELDEFAEQSSSPCTSSAHIHFPCFSMYELRHKHFSHMTGNSVYTYAYKHQIKSLKTPSHWVQVLKRMGGVQEHGFTCRLINVKHVKEMCHVFNVGSKVPSNLEALCRNDFPKTRILIDLSQYTPDQLLEADRLDVIPSCPFSETLDTPTTSSAPSVPGPSKTDNRKSRKLQRKRKLQQQEGGAEEPRKKRPYNRKPKPIDLSSTVTSSSGAAKRPPQSRDQSCDHSEVAEQSGELSCEHSLANSLDVSRDESLVGGEEEWTDEEEREGREMGPPPAKRPPPLIKHVSPIGSDKHNLKKKYCPQCDNPIARKCKKCPYCGKRFGVFTFGRKLCPSCGRINLARMTICFECGHPMLNAPKALPKGFDADKGCIQKKPSVERLGSIFGARKKRVHPFSASASDSSGGMFGIEYMSSSQRTKLPKKSQYQMAPPSNSLTNNTSHFSSSRHNSVGEGSLEGTEDMPASYSTSEDPALFSDEVKGEIPGDVQQSVKSKQSGYQYGRIPWNDSDITCILDDKGVAKFCLNELCSKVLHNHGKGHVFDMVKNLNLPVEHGGAALLKKLQALGLHSNRSPMCRLVASEELWTLLDALQEAVPEEVYQHLEHISTSSTPLLSPQTGAAPTGTSTAAAASGTLPGGMQSPGLVPTGTTAMLEEDEHGFESTLHEVQCSDGQSVSILRAYNGEQYACVTEFWRKYFPEVNRNHLTSALKRLSLETLMPTGQQATLLRLAGVISLRGAAGRLMKFGDMEKLMDDFGIPLQIGKPSDKPINVMGSSVGGSGPTLPHARHKLSMRRPSMRGYASMTNQHSASHHNPPSVPPGKVLMSKEDVVFASCMRNVLTSVNVRDLNALLRKSQNTAQNSTTGMDTETAGVKSELDSIQQLIHTRRTLCNVLSDEISYLTVSNHGFMTEFVRMEHMQKQVLKDIQGLLNTFSISLNPP